METALEVLSRAATMIQNNSNEQKLSTKELPTTKWRRERRLRNSNEYHNHHPAAQQQQQQQQQTSNINDSAQSTLTSSPTSSCSSSLTTTTTKLPNLFQNGINGGSNNEVPLDMSISKSARPPPPYREPPIGSTYHQQQQQNHSSRPSVITQAPKRENLPAKNGLQITTTTTNDKGKTIRTESISMVDPVIDEHFRRSLGNDYMQLFNKTGINNTCVPTAGTASAPAIEMIQKTRLTPSPISITLTIDGTNSLSTSPIPTQATSPVIGTLPPPISLVPKSQTNDKQNTMQVTSGVVSPEQQINKASTIQTNLTLNNNSISLSVDDHFAKALGDTWKKLKEVDEASTISIKNNININSNLNNSNDNISSSCSSGSSSNNSTSSINSISNNSNKKISPIKNE